MLFTFAMARRLLQVSYFLAIFLALSACAEKPLPLVSLAGKTMGTTYSVKYVAGPQQALTSEQMQTEIDSLLVNINQLMSTYIPDSELSLLNQAPAHTPIQLSPETSHVLEEAIRLHKLSQGMLDVTVGPLVNLWGFGPDAKPDITPTKEQLQAIRPFVGIDKFTYQNNQIIKLNDKVYIDLSTVAKGYAVDRIAEFLSSNGINHYLVEIGGEMRVAGTKPNAENWYIAIEKPISGERAIQRIITIGDNAIASSGDYRNYYEENGIRYSHLIDPKTGWPIQHKLVAVTVIAKTSLEADGLATALIVMGAENGIALAEENDIAALFITKKDGEFIEYQSTQFQQQVTVIN